METMTKPINKKRPNPIDAHVGSRVRLRRMMLNMSQEKLGEQLGITFQQVQKYEKGTNRIGASRLQAIANILQVPVAFFFEDAPDVSPIATNDIVESGATSHVMEFLSTNEGLQLNRAFVQIQDSKLRKSVVDLVRSMAGEKEE
jgi:transcriptional regulator with XRE-family HTH domain